MSTASDVRPVAVMERGGAVGWRDVALDGLNCYLRCIEAILRGHGFDAHAVAAELGGAVTDSFEADGRPHFRLRGGTARWHVARPGHDNWAVVDRRLATGRPVLVWPDAYLWPGDELHGKRHAHRHAVLVVGKDADTLRFLDINAAEADHFTATVPLDRETTRACTRVLEIDPPARRRTPGAAAVRRMVADSVAPLGRFAAGAGQLAGWWAATPPTRRLVHAVDLWALGDVQPQLYLLARLCRRSGFDDLAATAFDAARQAKKISLFLIGLHQHKPRAPYDLCQDDVAALGRKLRAVQRAAAAVAGRAGAAAPDGVAARRRAGRLLWEHLDASSRWHFGAGLGALDAYLGG